MSAGRPVTLVQFPRFFGVPNASPFCVKLELWLRLAGIDYTVEEKIMPTSAPKKKIPYIVENDAPMGDSNLIMEHLSRMRGVDLDQGLSDVERAQDRALWAMLDERLYWYIVFDRWLGEGWPQVERAFFGRMLPVVRPLMARFARRAVRRQLWEQGTGRHTEAEVSRMAHADIGTLATLVGEGPYIHGDTVRTIDAVAYAYAVNLTRIDLDTAMTRAARTHANLVAYVERITDTYFSDLA